MGAELLVSLDADVTGVARALEANVLTLSAERAYAPGRPVLLSLTLDGTALQLRGKCLGSKREADGRYAVRLRLVDLRREHREALQLALSAPASST